MIGPTAILHAAVVLAGLSLAVLGMLVLRRLLEMALRRRNARRRRKARRLIERYLNDELTAQEVRAQLPMRLVVDEAVRRARGYSEARRRRLRWLARSLDAADFRGMLRMRSRRKRLHSIYLLAFFDSSNVAEALRATLYTDPDHDIRLAAAKALVGIGRLPPLPEVLAVLVSEHADVSRIAHAILRKVPKRRLSELGTMALADEDPKLRLIAVEALGHSNSTEALATVLKAAADSHLDVRAAAVRALGRLGVPDSHGAKTVIAALDDPVWQVRCQAAVCAGRLRLDAAVPRLQALLEAPEWWVRFRAAEALYRIGEDARAGLHGLAAQPGRAGEVARAVLREKGTADSLPADKRKSAPPLERQAS